MGRQSVFDPSRLDDELDELLPPPRVVESPPEPDEPASDATEAAAEPAVETSGAPTAPAIPDEAEVHEQDAPQVEASPPALAPDTSKARRPRGNGGRPPVATTSSVEASRVVQAGFSVVAARIPTPLWQSVMDGPLGGRERPSYAQLISWTCLDHPDEVIAQIRASLVPDRTPRGRRLATPVNTITVRFRQDELAAFDELIERASTQGQRVTRTAGIIAALQVSIAHEG